MAGGIYEAAKHLLRMYNKSQGSWGGEKSNVPLRPRDIRCVPRQTHTSVSRSARRALSRGKARTRSGLVWITWTGKYRAVTGFQRAEEHSDILAAPSQQQTWISKPLQADVGRPSLGIGGTTKEATNSRGKAFRLGASVGDNVKRDGLVPQPLFCRGLHIASGSVAGEPSEPRGTPGGDLNRIFHGPDRPGTRQRESAYRLLTALGGTSHR